MHVGTPLGASAGPEIELAEHDLRGFAVRAASIRGLSHRQRGTERQDAFLCSWDEARGVLLVAVADGVGSKKRSREASTSAVRVAVEAWSRGQIDLKDVVREVNEYLLESVPRNEDGYRVGATTLTLAEIPIESGGLGNARVAWVGDTPVWTLSGGIWAETTPQDDDADGFAAPISALPATNLEVLSAVAPVASGAIFVMTDGVGNAIRNSSEARASLAEWWAEPPGVYTFGAQVEFARRSFVDDRTVVGVWAERGDQLPVGERPTADTPSESKPPAAEQHEANQAASFEDHAD
ncbi:MULTISPECIES: protein phosphatase 2C domain-containing protein [unclassified Rathayibacter]|uniref:protein phosphatase 2C domain-containing protein n=1 Tax=unclassified Rathayibacter TaxID=2609250 RepID=UPI0015E3C743|nr:MULTISPECIES: protein phosphatase 2C domain-containing protein [unclassified Rathayibacter]